MPDFGSFRGFGEKLTQGQTPTQLGTIGSNSFGNILLDLYPGASVAYSLRLVNSAYTGSSIRVRRSSDNAEQNIGFNTLSQLDTSALTSFCGTGDGFVVTWYDQSGNGNNATQSNVLLQPQIVSVGVVLSINGKPCMQFDGTNDLLQSSIYSSNKYGDYVFNAYQYNNVNQGGAIWSNGASNNGYAIGIGGTNYDNDGNKFVSLYSGVAWGNTSYVLNTNQALSTWTNFLNGSQSLWINSNQALNQSSIGATPNTPTTIARLGGTGDALRYAFVKIQEHIYYSSDQSTNRVGIENNINSYYAIY
jgi:hypothetical protein